MTQRPARDAAEPQQALHTEDAARRIARELGVGCGKWKSLLADAPGEAAPRTCCGACRRVTGAEASPHPTVRSPEPSKTTTSQGDD